MNSLQSNPVLGLFLNSWVGKSIVPKTNSKFSSLQTIYSTVVASETLPTLFSVDMRQLKAIEEGYAKVQNEIQHLDESTNQ